jgi:hypothetical protein
MNICEQYFNDICKLMRKYIERIQPQEFASVFGLFERLKRKCEWEGIDIGDVSDIYKYAKEEHIERFGFMT